MRARPNTFALDSLAQAALQANPSLKQIEARIRVAKSHGRILDGLSKVAGVRHRVNKGLLQDLLKAKLARRRIDDRLQTIAQRREAVEAQLNALLGQKTTAMVPKIRLPAVRPLTRTVPPLVALATRNRPRLAKWRQRIRVEQLRRRLARSGYRPDFSVSFTYRYRRDTGADPVEGMDFWSVGVAIRIPLWSLSATKAQDLRALARRHRTAAGQGAEPGRGVGLVSTDDFRSYGGQMFGR